MTRAILILAVLWSIGCAKHQPAEALSAHPSEWWEPTGSSCGDAMQINMIAEGCMQIGVQVIDEVWTEFHCEDSATGTWTTAWWLFTPSGFEPIQGYSAICVDNIGTLSIRDQ